MIDNVTTHASFEYDIVRFELHICTVLLLNSTQKASYHSKCGFFTYELSHISISKQNRTASLSFSCRDQWLSQVNIEFLVFFCWILILLLNLLIYVFSWFYFSAWFCLSNIHSVFSIPTYANASEWLFCFWCSDGCVPNILLISWSHRKVSNLILVFSIFFAGLLVLFTSSPSHC